MLCAFLWNVLEFLLAPFSPADDYWRQLLPDQKSLERPRAALLSASIAGAAAFTSNLLRSAGGFTEQENVIVGALPALISLCSLICYAVLHISHVECCRRAVCVYHTCCGAIASLRALSEPTELVNIPPDMSDYSGGSQTGYSQ